MKFLPKVKNLLIELYYNEDGFVALAASAVGAIATTVTKKVIGAPSAPQGQSGGGEGIFLDPGNPLAMINLPQAVTPAPSAFVDLTDEAPNSVDTQQPSFNFAPLPDPLTIAASWSQRVQNIFTPPTPGSGTPPPQIPDYGSFA